jgi:CheY-like chemotaxis protein
MTATNKPIRIFLADDDEDDRMLFSEALAELPINCKIYNFRDGIYLMGNLMVKETILPDIVFLDIHMPLLNGEACLLKIRQTERIRQLPVIIFSTSFDATEVEKYRLLGASCYLQKPNSFNQLKTLLYKCILPYSQGIGNNMNGSFVVQV